MKTKPSLKELEEQIRVIQKKLSALEPMHPGSISLQYQVCGRTGCKCQHPTHPQRHGPYCKLSYVHRGKKICRFVRADSVDQMKTRLDTYKAFRQLIDSWIELSIRTARIQFFSGAAEKPPRK